MSLWKDKLRGLSDRFLRAVGIVDAGEGAPAAVALSPEKLVALYAVFDGFEKERTLLTSAPDGGYNTLGDKAPALVLNARCFLIMACADRHPESGLWRLAVSTEGRLTLHDNRDEAPLTSSLFCDHIQPFEDRLVALGFRKAAKNAFGPFKTTIFEKAQLSDSAVNRTFAMLDVMLSQDKSVINLAGTRHDVSPAHRAQPYYGLTRGIIPLP